MEQSKIEWIDVAALARELSSSEGLRLADATQRAIEQLDGLLDYAVAWDRWVGTQRAGRAA